MPERLETIKLTALAQSDGEQEISVSGFADFFLITIVPSSGATGSLSFQIKPHVDAQFEDIIDPETNAQQILILTQLTRSFVVDGYFANGLKVIPSAIIGTYDLIIQQSSNLG